MAYWAIFQEASSMRAVRPVTAWLARLCIALLAPALCALALLPATTSAQTWPTRAVRIIVPFAAGGSVDILARLIAPRMSESLGVPVIVDNRAGGGAAIGAEAVAKAPPDGYTLLLTPNALAIMPSLQRSLGFDPVRDLAPLTLLASTDLVLVASSRLQAGTLAEMVAVAKAKPGSLNYGSTGVANPLHLSMEMLKVAAGIDIVPIPYKGDAPLGSALLAGEVDLAVLTVAAAQPGIRARWLRPLGLTGAVRSASLPEVPTLAEQGFAGFDTGSWQGLFVPTGTPSEAMQRLHRAAIAAIEPAEVRERLRSLGQTPVGSTPEAFATRFRADVARFATIVQQAGIKPAD
jgi:tripartite-type tricarboxylate transporter receptor subunit TctC